MTVATAQGGRRASTSTLRAAGRPVSQWVRPAAWLALPSVTGQQRFAGLHRIDLESNFVALTAAGDYTVDWGDGTTTNHASGSTAQKQYDYATIPNTGEASLGYRQVIIQVYPQAGQNLTSLSLQVRHNQSGLSAYIPGWLEVAVNGSNLAALSIGGSISLSYLEQATIGDHAMTSAANLFQNCRVLRSVPLFNTAAVTTMVSMFQSCSSLTTVPLFNTASVTSMASMFQSCSSLTTVPLFNTASVTSMGNMFQSCSSLTTVPLFNTASVTSMGNMFQSCSSLTTVPLFNTASVTSMASMFQVCFSLTTVPLFNTASVTNMASMFANCTQLAAAPAFNIAGASAAMSSMFSGCSSLVSVRLENMAAALNTANVFLNCPSLSSIAMPGYFRDGFSVANCKLSPAALNALYASLGTAAGSVAAARTITVTGNWGTVSDDPTIATAKNWIVTG